MEYFLALVVHSDKYNQPFDQIWYPAKAIKLQFNMNLIAYTLFIVDDKEASCLLFLKEKTTFIYLMT